uniref:Ribonuclease P protein subunit p30 n=1 Tax=Esox lucius TaxID=8010 RepID=A0AAY5L5A7_ESOLU
MAMFMDLNVSYTTDKKRLQGLIEKAAHRNYILCCFSYVKLIRLPIKVLNRLTIVATDPSHFRPTAVYKAYDLVAVFPKTEKLFHAACMTFDVDIICVAVSEKLPFYFKRSPVNGAIERGVFFELSYTPAIRDSTMRRYTIANAVSLMETCKGKNVIVTSGAERPLELRGPYDIANLGLLFGLSEQDGKAAVSTNCRAVHLHGETRKTALGIIHTMKKDQPLSEGQREVDDPPSKRPKIELS